MGRKINRLKLRWQEADNFISAVHSKDRVTGLTHDFYKYPARFSPQFCRAAIDVFSSPTDFVADPFVGGGTTLVEARATGRLGIGNDISSLAQFVSIVKTRTYSRNDLAYISHWFEQLPTALNLRNKVAGYSQSTESDYLRNLKCEQTWPIRKTLELGVQAASSVRDPKRQDFIRCVFLRSAQWALDGRKSLPSAAQFRERIQETASQMTKGAEEYSRVTRQVDQLCPAGGLKRTVCLHGKANAMANFIRDRERVAPKLFVTSPPYPGVHVLYHRWQVRGGRETPVPFWIANKLDGSGLAYYLMSARNPGLERYFKGIGDTFTSLHAISARDTTVVQLVAFSDPNSQLPRYLEVMSSCGFDEFLLSDHLDSHDGRLWRQVPGRKWHANSKGDLPSGNEVVLIHRPRF